MLSLGLGLISFLFHQEKIICLFFVFKIFCSLKESARKKCPSFLNVSLLLSLVSQSLSMLPAKSTPVIAWLAPELLTQAVVQIVA
jgi:hypothetical protein